jgi:uncharacterized membrane protein HdeD (DUF308 family)
MTQQSIDDIPLARGAAALLGGNWGWVLFRGILSIIFGLLALFFPFGAVFAFTALFAAFALTNGVLSIVAGVKGAQAHQQRWWSLILSGLVGVAVGVLFLLWPGISTISYALFAVLLIASWSLAIGALEIIAAIRLRRLITGEWLLWLSGVLSILLGLAVLYWALTDPRVSVTAVGWMIAYYALIAGVVQILLSLRLRRLLHAAEGG